MNTLDAIRFIDDPTFQPKGKRVLVRVDFNVPLANGEVSNDKRLRESLPTINALRDAGARVILVSHLGRPKGKVNPEYSLAPVAKALEVLLEAPVAFAADCIGAHATSAVQALQDGEVALLENLRFHPEEEAGDEGFAKALADHAELFVSDAFGTCHRAHASVSGVAKQLPAFGGLLIRKEVEAFGPLLSGAKAPYVAVLGGAKVSDKIQVIESLLQRVNTLLIGGGMAYTFLKAQGQEIGKSLLDSESLEFAKDMLSRAEARGVQVLLPDDHIVADDIHGANASEAREIPSDKAAFDIGPKSAQRFAEAIREARTVIFNGPMGVFEHNAFEHGTRAVLGGMRQAFTHGGLVVVGGGDSAAATEALGFANSVTHISTGGG
ncbi:MAG: phosphoglycerate kinase, partial [Planctomycetes bacterium]|nr:phosphoglycerate kinase [Planctomycetota bacterium]